MLKKDKMVSCGAPGCTNRADKNSSKMTVTIIILIQLYRGIFRTLVHLMPAACSKPCQTSQTVRHIENTGIIRTVYSGIFRHIQGHSAIISHAQAY